VPGLEKRTVLRIGEDFEPGAGIPQDHAGSSIRLLTPDRVAALFHTGGTTGAPMLVRHTHWQRGACLLVRAISSTASTEAHRLDQRLPAVPRGRRLSSTASRCWRWARRQVLPTVTGMRNAAFLSQLLEVLRAQKA
jgi:fatty-acyl-CoA synthase